jgi:hypothetical protein
MQTDIIQWYTILLETLFHYYYGEVRSTGGRLTENQLIKIVIFQLIESFNNDLIHI